MVREGRGDADPGVVAEHVDLAERRLGTVGGFRHRVAVGHVEGQRDGVGIAGTERGVRLPEGVLLDVGQGDLHAGARERPRHGQAQPARGAGDESDLAG